MSDLNVNVGPERVQVFPTSLGVVQVPGAATAVTAFLIATTKVGAPVNTPTPVTNLTDFVTSFGDYTNVAYNGYYVVEGFFNNAGTGATALIVNVGSSPTATDYIGNASTGTGLRALDTTDVVDLVCAPGLPLSMAYLVQPAVIDYAKTVRTYFGETLGTTFSLNAVPAEIQKANMDVAVGPTLTVSGVVGNVISFSGSPSLTGITPGMLLKKTNTIIGTVITAVDNTAKSITTASTPATVATDVLQAYTPSAVSYKELIVNDPSKTNAWYYNWVEVLSEDPLDSPGTLKATDPTGHVAGVIARIDANTSIGGPSHAAAGLQFAGISGINGLALTVSERSDAEPLRLNFINRITSFPGAGNVIFGAYTSDSGTSPTFTADDQLMQVIRSVQFIKASLEPGLRRFLWENFSPVTQSQIAGAILSFLRNNNYLFPAGLPEAQQFNVISVTPTTNELNEGLLRVRVQVKPNKAVRFIEVTLEYPLPSAA